MPLGGRGRRRPRPSCRQVPPCVSELRRWGPQPAGGDRTGAEAGSVSAAASRPPRTFSWVLCVRTAGGGCFLRDAGVQRLGPRLGGSRRPGKPPCPCHTPQPRPGLERRRAPTLWEAGTPGSGMTDPSRVRPGSSAPARTSSPLLSAPVGWGHRGRGCWSGQRALPVMGRPGNTARDLTQQGWWQCLLRAQGPAPCSWTWG